MKLLRASVILLAAILALTLWNAYSIESLRRGVELYEAAYPRDRVSVHPILLEDLKSSYVIFADGMEGSLKWTKYGSGEIGVTSHTSFGGGSSLMLRTGNGHGSSSRLFGSSPHLGVRSSDSASGGYATTITSGT